MHRGYDTCHLPRTHGWSQEIGFHVDTRLIILNLHIHTYVMWNTILVPSVMLHKTHIIWGKQELQIGLKRNPLLAPLLLSPLVLWGGHWSSSAPVQERAWPIHACAPRAPSQGRTVTIQKERVYPLRARVRDSGPAVATWWVGCWLLASWLVCQISWDVDSSQGTDRSASCSNVLLTGLSRWG